MAYSPSEKYPGAVDVDPDYQGGKFRDNNPSTTNNGSPLKAIDRNELLARDEAIMNDAGFEYSGLPDTPQDSQLFKAYKASLGNGANLLSNHNFLIQTPDDSQPLPSATPTSYPPGYQIFSGVFANETTGITNLTYIDGLVSFSGGDLYFPVPNTGAVERLTDFVASVADFDGKPRQMDDSSWSLVGDSYRVTVGIDDLAGGALGSVKFEQGSVATGHEAEYGVVATGSTTARTLGDRFADVVNVKDFGAVGDSSSDDTAAIRAALDTHPAKLIFPSGTYQINGTLTLADASNIIIEGYDATIVQTGDRLTNTLFLNRCTNISISTMRFRGTGIPLQEGDSGTLGQGVYIYGSDTIRFFNNEVFDQSGSGILCSASNNCWIDSNYMHDNLRLWDIAFGYASPPDNTPLTNAWITNNRCFSPDGAWGIHVQGYGKGVNIKGNHTQGHNDYGILCYRRDDFGAREWSDVVIADNIVEDVSDTQFSGYFAGMGIYIQTVSNVTVSGNVVRNVLQNRSDAASPNRTLPPGAISINGASEVTCTGNVVEDSGIDGIDVVNVSSATKGNTVSGNTISNAYRRGICCNATSKLTIANNTIDGTADDLDGGITIDGHVSVATQDINISGNVITQGFYYGITVSKGTGTSCNRVIIDGNLVRDVTGDYISVTDSGQCVVTSNSLHQTEIAHTTARYGIICSNADDVLIDGNMVKGGALQMSRGLAVVNSASPLVTSNLIQGISDIFYALFMNNNTDQNLYGNVNPRQGLPMFGPHAVGNDPSSDTSKLVTYGTSMPATGTQGSIHWNLTPVAGGTIGWACVATNTWKPFGNIDA